MKTLLREITCRILGHRFRVHGVVVFGNQITGHYCERCGYAVVTDVFPLERILMRAKKPSEKSFLVTQSTNEIGIH